MSVETAIQGALTGNAALVSLCTGGIHQMSAPPETPPPFLVWQKAFGNNTAHTLKSKVSDSDEYQFFAWAEDTEAAEGVATADVILEQLETVLYDASLSVSPRTLLYCRKRRNLPPQEDAMPGGAKRFGKGQQWHIEVS